MNVRELLPREHALWGWVGIPLFAVFAAAPSWTMALVALCTLAGFGAWNAAGRWLRGSVRAGGPALVAGSIAAVLAVPAVVLAPRPLVLVSGLLAAGLAAAVVTAATRGKVHQQPSAEAVGIAFLCSFAWLVGVGAGGDPRGLALLLVVVLTWLWLGLWWINRSLAPFLPNRVLWRRGPVVAGVAVAGSALAAFAIGPAVVGLLPLAYAGRIASSGAVRGARDARRVGLSELAWGLVLASVAANLV